jgi:hypothetical protein
VNAVLAKPIRTNWFIRPQPFDLHQFDAAALCAGLPSWLRDHSKPGKCCIAQSENFQKDFTARPLPKAQSSERRGLKRRLAMQRTESSIEVFRLRLRQCDFGARCRH